MSTKAFYETDGFLALRDRWYAKLKEEGHQDIEILDKITRQHGSLMHGPSPGDLNRNLYKPETEEYYRCCRLHYWRIKERPNAGEDRLRIWELHAEGYSQKRIQEATGYSGSRVAAVLRQEKRWMREEWDYELDKQAGEALDDE